MTTPAPEDRRRQLRQTGACPRNRGLRIHSRQNTRSCLSLSTLPGSSQVSGHAMPCSGKPHGHEGVFGSRTASSLLQASDNGKCINTPFTPFHSRHSFHSFQGSAFSRSCNYLAALVRDGWNSNFSSERKRRNIMKVQAQHMHKIKV